MSLTPTPSDQRTQQLAEVNPIGLRPTAAPIDLHARRVNHEALDATRPEEAREPKRVISRLVAEYDRWLLATHLRPAITGRDELCHQAFAVAAFERIDARLLTIGKLDTRSQKLDLLDDLGGEHQQFRRDGHAKGLGGPEVDYKFGFGRFLDRQVGRLCAFENLVDVRRSAPEIVREMLAIAHQSAGVYLLAEGKYRRHPMVACKFSDLLPLLNEECIGHDNDRPRVLPAHVRKSTLDLLR